jgi:hypothetical protein
MSGGGGRFDKKLIVITVPEMAREREKFVNFGTSTLPTCVV